jgi:PhnB protein
MSKIKGVPEGLRTVTPTLAIDGCAEAIEFYKKALGAKEVMRAPDPSGKKIWHASIQIGDSQIFVNDTFPEMGPSGGANKGRLWLYFEAVDDAWKRATDAGMTIRMPIADMFWGDRMGALSDKWGNEWTLAQRIKEPTPEEMKAAQDAFVAQSKK